MKKKTKKLRLKHPHNNEATPPVQAQRWSDPGLLVMLLCAAQTPTLPSLHTAVTASR
jgi:hypothetical protein